MFTKRLYLLLAATLLLALVACGGAGNEPAAAPAAPAETEMEEAVGAETDADAMSEDNDGEMTADNDEMAGEMEHEEEAMGAAEDDGEMMAEATAAPVAEDAMTDEDTAEEEEMEEEMAESAAADRPVWQHLPLVNAGTGETFTLADFAGKAVFVEPMATWCSNCRQQLKNVKVSMRQVDMETAVFVALSVETNISADDLAAYAENEGFDWTFAVATPELIQALVAEFGQAITNPPSTPHFVIRPDGSATDLVTGIEQSGAIASQIEAALQ